MTLTFDLLTVSGPCARLSWPSRQLLSARWSTVSYRIVSYPIINGFPELVVEHYCIKFGDPICSCFWCIVWINKQTDKKTDRQTPLKTCPRDFRRRGWWWLKTYETGVRGGSGGGAQPHSCSRTLQSFVLGGVRQLVMASPCCWPPGASGPSLQHLCCVHNYACAHH